MLRGNLYGRGERRSWCVLGCCLKQLNNRQIWLYGLVSSSSVNLDKALLRFLTAYRWQHCRVYCSGWRASLYHFNFMALWFWSILLITEQNIYNYLCLSVKKWYFDDVVRKKVEGTCGDNVFSTWQSTLFYVLRVRAEFCSVNVYDFSVFWRTEFSFT